MSRIRVPSPSTIAQLAAANHVPAKSASHFASVDVDGVRYFWSAA